MKHSKFLPLLCIIGSMFIVGAMTVQGVFRKEPIEVFGGVVILLILLVGLIHTVAEKDTIDPVEHFSPEDDQRWF